MNALVLVLVTFSLVPFALSSRRLPSASSGGVIDIKGNELQVGKPYYAVSSAFIHPEGLCLLDLTNQTSLTFNTNETSSCPHDVIQCTLLYEPFVGMGIIFSPSSSSGGANLTEGEDDGVVVVKEDTPYSIKFNATTGSSCGEKDLAWGLVSAKDTNMDFVKTDPTANAVEFQLKKNGIGYQIAYCESTARFPLCYGIGFVQDAGYISRLGVGWGVRPATFFFGTTTEPKPDKYVATSNLLASII